MSDAWRAENKGPESLVAIITVTVLSTVFTGARLFVRGKILGKVHLDDYLIIASVICSWVSVATAIVAVAYGMGLHFDTLTRDQQQKAIFWTIVGFPAGVMSFGLPKLAVVALLTRILNPSAWHKRFLWGLSLFCLLNLTANMVLLFTHCQPPRSQWDFDVPSTCLDKWILVSFAIYTGSFGAFVDASTVVAIYKCTRVPSLASKDFTYETADLVIWTIVEGGTMIIAACIPILQPLGELIFGKRLFSSGGGRRTYENYGLGPSGQMRSENIELSRGHKRTPRQQDTVSFDDLDTTTTTAVAKGSQESILGQHDFSGKIMRTDAFTVSIEQTKKKS
ncbi:integral membrane protein [Colletotrichum chrysophilum]|uniref:Integral membrane protein n=1 Tax=Colletotrichum chrysophilum TaxID=1836956 RepID=A0AAD9EQ87_9PEZI|nr:integral membrane protein [Colletotrichum chrysophilum]